jgi:hypothetical protein
MLWCVMVPPNGTEPLPPPPTSSFSLTAHLSSVRRLLRRAAFSTVSQASRPRRPIPKMPHLSLSATPLDSPNPAPRSDPPSTRDAADHRVEIVYARRRCSRSSEGNEPSSAKHDINGRIRHAPTQCTKYTRLQGRRGDKGGSLISMGVWLVPPSVR